MNTIKEEIREMWNKNERGTEIDIWNRYQEAIGDCNQIYEHEYFFELLDNMNMSAEELTKAFHDGYDEDEDESHAANPYADYFVMDYLIRVHSSNYPEKLYDLEEVAFWLSQLD